MIENLNIDSFFSLNNYSKDNNINVERAKSTIDIGLSNEMRALDIIHRFGWLRSQEVGRYVWPGSKNWRTYGLRLCEKLIEERYLDQYKLPSHSGTALCLSIRGGTRLRNAGCEDAKKGSDIGRIHKDGVWMPRPEWKHDLLTSSAMLWLRNEFYDGRRDDLITSREFRIANGFSRKVPSGMVFINGQLHWMQVENTKKSGAHMRSMVLNAINVMNDGVSVSGFFCNKFIVVCPLNSKNYLGQEIRHKNNVRNAIKANLGYGKSVEIMFLEVNLISHAVRDVIITKEVISN